MCESEVPLRGSGARSTCGRNPSELSSAMTRKNEDLEVKERRNGRRRNDLPLCPENDIPFCVRRPSGGIPRVGAASAGSGSKRPLNHSGAARELAGARIAAPGTGGSRKGYGTGDEQNTPRASAQVACASRRVN